MKEFLRTVADHYRKKLTNPDNSFNSLGLVDYLFVFPNRRSGLFFNQYLIEDIHVPIVAPNMTTISELFPRLDTNRHLRILDRIELLFQLYVVYKQVSRSSESFDSFMFWGEMIIGDFNDADKYLVNTKLLFKNLKELKEIEEEFYGLEEDQIKIIKTFWKNFNPEKSTPSKEVFRQTWQILNELYVKFKESLLKNGTAYDGMLQRMIVEDLKESSKDLTLDEERTRLEKILGKKIVFVGLTAVSATEVELMKHLYKYDLAEFCWDYVDERLNDKNSHASYFKSSTIDKFPNIIEEQDNYTNNDIDRNFEVIEVPSGVGQTVQAANIIRGWITGNKKLVDPDERDKSKSTNAFHTAIVLPDEKMLLPMLYSIPKELEPFNVTMGYSLKSTTIATFVDNLAHLQVNIQKNKSGKYTFYYKNVLPLLSSNYLLNLSDGKASEISTDIVKTNKYRISVDIFKGNQLLEAVFKPCGEGKSCIDYLRNIFEILATTAEKELLELQNRKEYEQDNLFATIEEEERVQGIFYDVEREFLHSYIKLLSNLEDKLNKFAGTIDVTKETFFTLLHKLAQSETVAFSGEPLSGLQVMGVLETRAVDFDNLIILSMNEGVFPAKPQTNTFIPMNLRHAFGMPTQEHRDAVFAYHFYRLISRAKNVIMIYDSRSEGMQSGEPSRYIKQLSYLYHFDIKYKTVQYDIGVEGCNPIEIEKNQQVMLKLNNCLSGVGKRNLSASVLKYYTSCQLKFYYEFVEGLREEDEIAESIDDKAFGTILHSAMEKIYEPVKGRLVQPSDIENVIKDEGYIRRIIESCFLQEMHINDISGYLHIVEEIIITYVIDILKHDRELAPFYYIDSEQKETVEYEVNPSVGNPFKVNIVAVYDRIDRMVNGTLRIVDYKTGKSTLSDKSSKLLVPDIPEIFKPESSCSDEAFQVMLYSLLYKEAGVSPNLYFVRDFHSDPELSTELKSLANNEPIKDFDNHKRVFKDAFDRLLSDIFNPKKKFVQTENERNCKYCQFKEICKKG